MAITSTLIHLTAQGGGNVSTHDLKPETPSLQAFQLVNFRRTHVHLGK